MVKLQREAMWCDLAAAKSWQDVADDPHEVLASWHDKIREVIVRTNLGICICMCFFVSHVASVVISSAVHRQDVRVIRT